MDSGDLSILNWNVRGLNDAAHRELVREAIVCARPAIVCLQETKLNVVDDNLAQQILGPLLNSYLALNAQGTRGGILLAWNKDIVSINSATNRSFSISATVQIPNATAFMLTTCYGPADDARKDDFLTELRTIRAAVTAAGDTVPWLIIGDFNLIYQASDKNNLNLNRRMMGRFRKTLDDCELMELSLQNRRFTWSNERQEPTMVRLDRAFCDAHWEAAFPNFALSALSTGASDHCPLMLNRQDRMPRKAAFRFENHWLHVAGFHETVQEAWGKPQTGSALTVLGKKLAETAKALRGWSKTLFSNARLQLHIANEVIFRLDLAQEARSLSDEEISLRHDLKLRILGLATLERSRRRQASRINYIKAGDACTRFFHLKMAARRRRKYISSLRNSDGSWAVTYEAKQSVLQNFFVNLLGEKVRRQRTFSWQDLHLTQLQQQPGLELDRPFTADEIGAAVKDLPNNKAPGPDGFTNDFYKQCWDIIKIDILAAFNAVYLLQDFTLKNLNRAHIVLIPKMEVSTEPKDFRPISLIHSFAKLLTKVLAARLSCYIDRLISSAQSAFIKKRCIQDNYMYVRGLARHYHRTKTPACLIKVDITKAFDSVSWEYMLELLSRRGFPTRWREWLVSLLKSSSSRIMLNGCLGDEIKHRRGLRQGDPLSPYLFILAIDVLNNIFHWATEHGLLSKLKGRHSSLRLSMYADDAVIFTNPKQEDISCIVDILRAFGEATGLRINMQKSTIALIRCADIDVETVLQSFPGPRINFPMRYLGLPLTLGRTRMVHLQYIQDRARARVAGCQGRLMNVAGRRELVRSVLTSLPVYLLTVIKAPKQFIKELDKIRRKFLWTGDREMTGGKCKVAWEKTCMPITNGGAGIINMDKFSRALRLRWLWFEWDERDRPWYGLELPVDKQDIALFNAATLVTVGNGEKAQFWTSRWLQGEAPATMYPALYKHSKRKNRTVKDAIIGNKWIQDIDYNMTVTLLTQFIDLWQQVQQTTLSPEDKDSIIWRHTTDGQYSAKSAYQLQFIGKTRSLTANITWATKAPPKCRFFIWLMLQNRVWTAARLLLREWPNEYFCPLCVRNLETIYHLLQECKFAREVWSKVASWISAPVLNPTTWSQDTDFQSWFIELGDSGLGARKEGVRSITMLTAWEIWKERNNRIFNKESKSAEQLLGSIQNEARTWILAGNRWVELVVPPQMSIHSEGLDEPNNVIL
jgi:exonuclease III